jgi:hypothetical protein
MLSDEEKREMLEDGRSQARRKDLSFGRTRSLLAVNRSLDGFIVFLNSIQNTFGPFHFAGKKTITTDNRL